MSDRDSLGNLPGRGSYAFVAILSLALAVGCAWIALGTNIWIGFRIIAGLGGLSSALMVWRAIRQVKIVVTDLRGNY